tara:strand:+ start:4068 stop:4226 length:159 start_codon:yes stop_codon:yes gene_type:complete
MALTKSESIIRSPRFLTRASSFWNFSILVAFGAVTDAVEVRECCCDLESISF